MEMFADPEDAAGVGFIKSFTPPIGSDPKDGNPPPKSGKSDSGFFFTGFALLAGSSIYSLMDFAKSLAKSSNFFSSFSIL
jgi:hypothetical protein